LIYEDKDLAVLAVDAMKAEGFSLGRWGAWKPDGDWKEKCGILYRNLRRTCDSGNDCIGNDRSTEVHRTHFDKTSLTNCMEREEEKSNVGETYAMSCKAHRKQYYTLKNRRTGQILAVDPNDISNTRMETISASSGFTERQKWRKEESFDKPGYFRILSQHYGRAILIKLDTGEYVTDWKLRNGRLESGSGFLQASNSLCQPSEPQSGDVVYYPNEKRSNNRCQLWDMDLVPEPVTTQAPLITAPTTTTTTTAPPPRNLNEFLRRHGPWQMGAQRIEQLLLANYLDLAFIQEYPLTHGEMSDLGITSFRDRKKLRSLTERRSE